VGEPETADIPQPAAQGTKVNMPQF
jgi:hypothetical protein